LPFALLKAKPYNSPLAGVAQLVEQRIRNAKVVGSTPISGTIHKKGSLLAALFISTAAIPLP
jgi:hypothetical protein